MGGFLLSPNDGHDARKVVRQNRIIIGLTVLVVMLTAALVYAAFRPTFTASSEFANQANVQATSTSDMALANCLSQADSEYDQRWNTLCTEMGQGELCDSFIGSPKDIQLTQIRNQEQGLCATLYK